MPVRVHTVRTRHNRNRGSRRQCLLDDAAPLVSGSVAPFGCGVRNRRRDCAHALLFVGATTCRATNGECLYQLASSRRSKIHAYASATNCRISSDSLSACSARVIATLGSRAGPTSRHSESVHLQPAKKANIAVYYRYEENTRKHEDRHQKSRRQPSPNEGSNDGRKGGGRRRTRHI